MPDEYIAPTGSVRFTGCGHETTYGDVVECSVTICGRRYCPVCFPEIKSTLTCTIGLLDCPLQLPVR
jgi:hypothetical protein